MGSNGGFDGHIMGIMTGWWFRTFRKLLSNGEFYFIPADWLIFFQRGLKQPTIQILEHWITIEVVISLKCHWNFGMLVYWHIGTYWNILEYVGILL